MPVLDANSRADHVVATPLAVRHPPCTCTAPTLRPPCTYTVLGLHPHCNPCFCRYGARHRQCARPATSSVCPWCCPPSSAPHSRPARSATPNPNPTPTLVTHPHPHRHRHRHRSPLTAHRSPLTFHPHPHPHPHPNQARSATPRPTSRVLTRWWSGTGGLLPAHRSSRSALRQAAPSLC